ISYRPINNLSVGQATTLALDPKSNAVYTGLQDNGTMRGTRGYVPGRSPLDAWKSINGGDGSFVALDPREDLDLVYAASQFGAHTAIVQKTGARYRAAAPRAKGLDPLRYNWISPFLVSPYLPDEVFVGSQYLHRSFDRGKTWTTISPDLTRNRPNGDVPYSTIKDVSESPLRFGLMIVGADDGRVTLTPDGGYQWIDIPTPAPGKWVTRVIASQHDAETLYCAQSGYREDDFAAYLWRSADRGKTWSSIVGDLPAETINVVREDPKEPRTLYNGTDLGVWVTRDAGAHWEPLGTDMGHLPVHDLAIHAKDDEIVIATHARGLMTTALRPLRLVDAGVRKEALKVLDAPDVRISSSAAYPYREIWGGVDEERPVAKLALWTGTAGTATIELVDEKGGILVTETTLLRRGYNEATLGLTVRPGKPLPAGVIPTPPKTGEEALRDPYAESRPVYVAPGAYTLRVRVGAATADSKLRIAA
ncbi:hypothetical protein EON77_08995, partial [bacterium]